MKIHYLIESCEYSVSSLENALQKDFKDAITDLARRGIYQEKNNTYTIAYVGIIAFNKTILAILPKFFESYDLHMDKEKELKIIMQVLKQHARKQNNSIENNLLYSSSLTDNSNQANRLALIDDIFHDYIQHGLYLSNKHMEEINGYGEINWETTMDKEQAHIINNLPIYLDLHTNHMTSDNDHYITRLHKYILIKAKEELETFPIQTILEDIMNVPTLDFTYDTDHFINIDLMTNAIDHELQDILHERKTILLHKMKRFITDQELHSEKSLKLWGVHNFWSVWESICKNIFQDESKIYNAYLQQAKPYYQKQNTTEENPVPTLIPDIIIKRQQHLLILDAKYYNFTFNTKGRILGNPPKLESIVKQFSYELALTHINNDNINNDNINNDNINNDHTNYKYIHNYFCIPTCNNQTKIIGSLYFPIFDNTGTKPIKILQLSHTEVFHMYIHNKQYPQEFYGKILENILTPNNQL